MAKKLSVAEIMAAARAEKSGGATPKSAETTADSSAPAAEAPVSAEAAESVAPAPAAEETAPAPTAKPAGKVAPGGKGMSMADILAAARAAKGGAAPAAKAAPKAAVAEKPAKAAVSEKPKAAVAEKAAPKPAAKEGNGAAAPKDTASILAAARKGAKPGPVSKSEAAALAKPTEPAGKKKLDVPPMPAKPDYAKPRAAAVTDDTSTRRSFLAMTGAALFGSSMAIGFSALAATHLMWLLGLARFMFPNILIEPPTRFKVGFPDTLAPGQVETKFIPQFGVWIVKYEFESQPMIFALKAVCTHLGCTPNWLEAEQKFKCPCHGSGFYKDGVNFEGPAPRPLERYAISVADDGQLLVDKSRTFQEEMGQWKDPASFVPV
jgi:cytochrome b6-f complex iron-sulfur subunit